MKYTHPLFSLAHNHAERIDNCSLLIDLIHLKFSHFGLIELELFPLPHLKIEADKIFYLYIGLVSGCDKDNEPCIAFLAELNKPHRDIQQFPSV